MYAEHQPLLSKLGRSGPEGFARICTFVLLTIRVPLYDAVMDYPLVRAGERAVRSVWGFKHRGLAQIESAAPTLWERCEDAYEGLDDEDGADVIVRAITELSGFGPTKAGFVAQMVYGLSGCIDTHNLTRFQLPYRFFRFDKGWAARRRDAIVRDYNAFCRKAGGAARLWDDWCSYVSARDPG